MQSNAQNTLPNNRKLQDYISKYSLFSLSYRLFVSFYRGTLRKLAAKHIHVPKRFNLDRYHDEQYRVRRDFD